MRFWLRGMALAMGLWPMTAWSGDACPDMVRTVHSSYGLPHLVEIYRTVSGLGAISPRYAGNDTTRWSVIASSLDGAKTNTYYFNCHFNYALETLERRRQLLGEGHPYVQAWIKNQEAVFQACDSYGSPPGDGPILTEWSDDAVNTLARYDYAYQKAAHLYYAELLGTSRQVRGDARQAFENIVSDVSSPHRPTAAYMLILRRIQQANFLYSATEAEAEINAILAEVNHILADPLLAPVHRITRQLLDVLAYQAKNKDLLHQQIDRIGAALSKPIAEIEADPQTLKDYLQSEADLDWFVSFGPPNGPRTSAFVSEGHSVPILNWLRIMAASQNKWRIGSWLAEAEDEPSMNALPALHDELTDEALRRFDAGEGLQWMAAGLSRIGPSHPRVAELLSVFDHLHENIQSCTSTPGETVLHPTFRHHAIRLMLGRGERDRAVLTLQAKPPQGAASNDYQHTLLTAARWFVANGDAERARKVLALLPPRYGRATGLRQIVARNLDEFWEAVPQDYLLSETRAVLNLLPVSALVDAAGNEQLPQRFRAEIARVAWTRAYFLRGVDGALAVSPVLALVDPEIAPQLKRIRDAWGKHHKENKTALLLARHPGMRLRFGMEVFSEGGPFDKITQIDKQDRSDGNWWCPLDVPYDRQLLIDDFYNASVQLPRGDARLSEIRSQTLAQHPVLKLIDDAELSALEKVPSGPEFLSRRAVAWARSTNWWDRLLGHERAVPEMLALAVRSTRYGCERAGGHGAYSRQAFAELHNRYPESDRAKQTRYWFDCEHFRMGCTGPYSLADLFRKPEVQE